MPSDPRIERLRHDAEMADLDRIARPDPDVNPLIRPGYAPWLAAGPAPLVVASSQVPTTFLDAPPPPRHSPQDDHVGRGAYSWPSGGRRLAVTKYCKCGPCHPMHDLTLNFDFLRAALDLTTGRWSMSRDTTSMELRYRQDFTPNTTTTQTSADRVYQWVGTPHIWTGSGSPPASWSSPNALYGYPTASGFGVTASVTDEGTGSPPTFYVQRARYDVHRFTLTCDRGGFALMHEMYAPRTVLNSGVGLYGTLSPPVYVGYRMYRRGVNTRCTPTEFRLTFPDSPDSWESVDAATNSPDGHDYLDDAYASRPSGEMRPPRSNVNRDGSDRQGTFVLWQNWVDPPGWALNADITATGPAGQPPFGTYSLGVTWSGP